MNEELRGKMRRSSLRGEGSGEVVVHNGLAYKGLSVIPASRLATDAPRRERSSLEAEQQFVEAVKTSMEGPLLRYSKRLELMDRAEKLNIGRFQANLLIAQAQQRTGRAEEILVRRPGETQSSSSTAKITWRDRAILAGAIFILVALVDMILIRLFFSK